MWFRAKSRERSPRRLDHATCWYVSGVRSGSAFFRAIPTLIQDATHVFLEGSPAPDVVALVQPHVDETEYGAPEGTIWSWPQRNRRLSLRVSPKLFALLAEVAPHHAEPEICDHLHVYREDEPLLHWFDAFDDPIQVSKSIPRETVERFCTEVGGVLSDGLPR